MRQRPWALPTPEGREVLFTPEGREVLPRAPHRGLLKKSPMNPKTFIEKDKIPSEDSASNVHPSEGILMKVLLQF